MTLLRTYTNTWISALMKYLIAKKLFLLLPHAKRTNFPDFIIWKENISLIQCLVKKEVSIFVSFNKNMIISTHLQSPIKILYVACST